MTKTKEKEESEMGKFTAMIILRGFYDLVR